MNEPPNSRYLAPARSGQPIVWMTRLSGVATRQTSLTPSAQTCGFSPSRPNCSIAAPVKWPCVPSARTVRRATRRCNARGLPTAPERRCEPGCLPFSITATGTSPRRSATAGASARSCPSLIAHARPAGPAPTIATPTSIRSSSGSVGGAIASVKLNGGGKSEGFISYERSDVPKLVPRKMRSIFHVYELGQLRDDLVQVADDAEVGVLEDRRIRVLVDRDDHIRSLHAHLVLDRAGDADRNVKPGRDGLSGLADLGRVGVPAGVDNRARCRHRAAERLRELLDQREILGAAEAAAAGHDHVGVLD